MCLRIPDPSCAAPVLLEGRPYASRCRTCKNLYLFDEYYGPCSEADGEVLVDGVEETSIDDATVVLQSDYWCSDEVEEGKNEKAVVESL